MLVCIFPGFDKNEKLLILVNYKNSKKKDYLLSNRTCLKSIKKLCTLLAMDMFMHIYQTSIGNFAWEI